jgi:hypothetical protein
LTPRQVTITVAQCVLLVLFVRGTVVGLGAGSSPGSQESFYITVIVYVAVGFVINTHQRKKPLGWLFLLVGTPTGLAALADGRMAVALADGNPAAWYRPPETVTRDLIEVVHRSMQPTNVRLWRP